MNQEQFFLRPNVVAEPLVDGWYAWAHLIPPSTLARNLTGRHLKIMESYIQSPETHEAAVKNPKLLGGPFMDFKERSVEQVKQLQQRTLQVGRPLIALSQAIDRLDNLLDTPLGLTASSAVRYSPESPHSA